MLLILTLSIYLFDMHIIIHKRIQKIIKILKFVIMLKVLKILIRQSAQKVELKQYVLMQVEPESFVFQLK